MNKIKIGKYLEKLRIAAGLNRSEAASAIGTIYKSILDWEKGVMPSNESLMALARLYNVTVDDILECGQQLTIEEFYEKYSLFKPFDFNNKIDKNKDYYTPYQSKLITVNTRLKELIMLFKKRVLSRSEDLELRFFFTNMCAFSDYYYEEFDDENKDSYLCFIEVLNYAKDISKTNQEYYYEVRKYIDIKNHGFHNPFPEYANPEKDELKDQQFKTLEDWEKDFYLALVQNNDMILDASKTPFFLEEYEQRYGCEFNKEKVVKELIKYFIKNGAVLNPWLYSYRRKKKVTHSVLDTLEELYLDYLKPIFIHFYNPHDENDGIEKYAFVENNEQNRFLNNYEDYVPYISEKRIDPKQLLHLFSLTDEKEIVDYIYSLRKKHNEDKDVEYRFKKAEIDSDLRYFYKCRDIFINDKQLDGKRIEQIKVLEEKLKKGETTFFEYEFVDIANENNFDHWKLMKRWKNQLTYSQFMKKRDSKLTADLLTNIDNLSLEEIRNRYFAKEEVEIKDE